MVTDDFFLIGDDIQSLTENSFFDHLAAAGSLFLQRLLYLGSRPHKPECHQPPSVWHIVRDQVTAPLAERPLIRRPIDPTTSCPLVIRRDVHLHPIRDHATGSKACLDALLYSVIVEVTHNGSLVPTTCCVGSHLAQVEVLHPDSLLQLNVLPHQPAVVSPYLLRRPPTSPAAIGAISVGFAAAHVGPRAGRHGG